MLDVLATSLQRQKEIASGVAVEVDEQLDLLDGLDERTTRSRLMVERENRRIEEFSVKSSTCWLWLIVLFLTLVFCAVLSVALYFPKQAATLAPVGNATTVTSLTEGPK